MIADAASLCLEDGVLQAGGKAIDLVYNRLVDFTLAEPRHGALHDAYEAGAVVVTPNPHIHALLANKRNLDPADKPRIPHLPRGFRHSSVLR